MAKMRERSGSPRKERNATGSPMITTAMSAHSSTGDTTVSRCNYDIPQLPVSLAKSAVEPYASTTDEDDGMSFYQLSASSSASTFNTPIQDTIKALTRRRSNRGERRTSITTIEAPSDVEMDDEWDYSETEWWGWVVLIATWLVFVVVMGSCLGVWSWAWDVGETPYAPPELEDDATLPITGYYPALMVCTAIMAWVWVVVAWVGMKYFRHAKVNVDA